MRCMRRNMREFYYATFERTEETTDEYGNKTGEYEVIYSKPKKYKGNVSTAQGEMQTRQFGDSESYDRTIAVGKKDVPFDEHSILWVDTLPIIESDGTTETPYDYLVKEVARGLDSTIIAISKVNVNVN